MARLRSMLLAVLAGAALNGAFPDVGWWPLAPISVAILWWVLDRGGAWWGFWIGWLYGMGFLAIHVWWASVAVDTVPWVALFVAEGVAFGLFGAAWAHVRQARLVYGKLWLAAPVFALLWVGMEQLRSMVPFGGFPWGRIAFSQADAPVARLAWLGGVPVVSFAVVLAGALLAIGVDGLRRRAPLAAALAPFLAIVVVMIGIAVPLDSRATEGTMRLAMVQGNVPNAGLDAFAQARQVTENHLAGTQALVASDPGPIDLLVWPENSADFDPRTDERTFATVTEAAVLADAPLLLGTNDYSPEDGRYNSSLLWSTQGAVLDEYRKQRPAPFAEYIPIRGFARLFSPAVDRVTSDVIAGDQPATMFVPLESRDGPVVIGPIICFEVAYDGIIRDSVANGAELLIVQTNNASFGMTAESTQQLAMTRLRAIETGRATVQISTVGVSGVVAPDGRLLESTGLFTAEQMYAEVPLRAEITPAVRWGGVIGWGTLILAIVLVIQAIGRRVGERYEW